MVVVQAVNRLLIQAVFNKALFVPGGPNIRLLVTLVAIMAVVPIVNGAIGILQTYETTRVGQQVMRDLRDRLYAHLQTLSLAFFRQVVESGTHRSLLRQNGVYASLYQEQFEGGKVQWQCTGGDIMADGTIRHRETQPA